MSKYTVQLRYLVEKDTDIGLNNYPIFNEDYRRTLNQNIIQHYYFREIGCETAAEFAFRMNAKMSLIMPYYNKLYTSLAEIKPFVNHDIKEVYTSQKTTDRTGETAYTVDNSGNSENKFSDTPQGELEDVREGRYLTNFTADSASSSTEANTTTDYQSTADMDSERTLTGIDFGKSYSEMFSDYEKALRNLDELIIKELEPLFLMIW